MLKFGFLGFGQAGGKIVDQFLTMSDLYEGMVVNTAINDLEALERVPESHRIALYGVSFGAGRTPEVAYNAMLDSTNGPEITETARRVFRDTDFIWLVAGLGGGTGTGAIMAIAEYASQLWEQPVGLIATLPRDMDGLVQKANAMSAMATIDQCVASHSIGAVVILDNERFFEAFAEEGRSGDWRELANRRLAQNLHDINRLTREAGKDNFDRADFLRQLQTPGFMLLGFGRLNGAGKEIEDVFRAVRNTVERGHLSAGYRLEETQLFTILYTLKPELQFIKSAASEQYLSNNLMQTFPTAVDRFYGYYDAKEQEHSTVLSILAGLGAPERVFEIGQEVSKANVEQSQKRLQFDTPTVLQTIPTVNKPSVKEGNPFIRGSGSTASIKPNPFLRK